MSTLQISAPIAADSPAEIRHPGRALRILLAVIDAVADTNRRRAEREIARIRRYGLTLDRA